MSDADSKTLGTPDNPLMVKCTSVARAPGDKFTYMSAVTEKGLHICLGFGLSQTLLASAQFSKEGAIMVSEAATVEPPAA